jgi:hypothetical protein
MSRHRKHYRREESRQEEPRTSEQNLNLNGFDLSSIASLINNIDVNEISSYVNNLNKNNNSTIKDNPENAEGNFEEDEAAMRKNELIRSITNLINADKAELLQIVIQLFAASRNTNK